MFHVVLGCLVLLCVGSMEGTSSWAEELRLMTYNIRNCQGASGKEPPRVEPIAEVIAAQSPDLVCVQELDQNTQRCGNRDLPSELETAVKMACLYAPASPYDGGLYGIATLVKEKPLNQWVIPLQKRFPDWTKEHQVLQILEYPKFVVFHTHMSQREHVRLEWLKVITEEVEKFNKPIFLIGDFNAWPKTRTLQEIQRLGWRSLGPEEKTFPATAPTKQIDHIFVLNAPDLVVKKAEVLDTQASDHRPVVVEAEMN